eukprot:9023082-Ditylum_brightwellii.AAC.1
MSLAYQLPVMQCTRIHINIMIFMLLGATVAQKEEGPHLVVSHAVMLKVEASCPAASKYHSS